MYSKLKIPRIFYICVFCIFSVKILEAKLCFWHLVKETHVLHDFPEESQLSRDANKVAELKKIPQPERREELRAYAAPPKKTLKEKALVLADYAMLSLLSTQIAGGFYTEPHLIVNAIMMAPPVLFSADLLSQVVHKWFDSYASEKNPIFGKDVADFRKHHEVPYNLEKEDYLSNAVTFGKVSAPFLATALFVDWSPEWGASVWLFMLAMMNATECHKQAHLNNPNKFFGILQSLRLSIGHREHMAHHTPPYDGEYAVLNGWSNGLLRRMDLWKRLDQLWWKVVKKMPHNWIQDPRSIPPSVIQELSQGLAEVPPELWEYAPVNENRVPPPLKPVIAGAKEKWQRDFIEKRRMIYRQKATDEGRSMEEDWLKEQLEFPWIYGNSAIPLN